MAFGETWSGPEHGEEFWDWMDAQRAPSQLRQEMLDYAQQARNLIEIGCGAGHFVEQLARRGWEGRYRGYDFSPSALEVANRRLQDNNVHGNVTQGDFMVQEVEPAGMIVACGVLQHQPSWMPMVTRCLEVAPRVVFGIGYVNERASVNTVRHYKGHSDWRFNPIYTERLLAGEGFKVLDSRVLPNPLRRTRGNEHEWLLVVGR